MFDGNAFAAAGKPGQGSNVGDFVPGKKGGWVPRNHPDAATDTPMPGSSPDAPTRVQGDPLAAVPGTGGAVGATSGEAGPSGPAMGGLRAAAASTSSGGSGVAQLPPQGASNPQLGNRIYPVAMRQLSLLPRIY